MNENKENKEEIVEEVVKSKRQVKEEIPKVKPKRIILKTKVVVDANRNEISDAWRNVIMDVIKEDRDSYTTAYGRFWKTQVVVL